MAKPSTMTAEIDVDAPIEAVYNQWTQFESFPQFLHAVKEVTQNDDAAPTGSSASPACGASSTRRSPSRCPISSSHGRASTGRATAAACASPRVSEGITHVALEMIWLPETFVEKVGAALNVDERQAQTDLERFKTFIEERGRETGGWRGEIHDSVPERDLSAPEVRCRRRRRTTRGCRAPSTPDEDLPPVADRP